MITGARLDRAGRELELIERHAGKGRKTRLPEWADDPVGFSESIGRVPVDYQRDIMRSAIENRRTAVSACHSAGKEWVAGSTATHAAVARGMLAVVISATEGQALRQTMREVRAAVRAAARVYQLAVEIYRGSIRIGGEDRIIALPGGATVDAMAGWHDPAGVMVIISEGQGERLEDVAYDAAFGIASDEESRILAMGNPVRPIGRFYDINHRPGWKVFRVSAFDTPNIKAGKVVARGFPAPGWPAEVAAEYGGTSSPYYVSRVLAEFPEQDEAALITREMLDRATELHRSGALAGEAARSHYVIGCDPARLGPDRSVICIRRGPVVEGFEEWRQADTMASADRIMGAVRGLLNGYSAERPGGGVKAVHVDEIGLGGGVLDRLAETLPRVEWVTYTTGYQPRIVAHRPKAEGFAASKSAANADRFRNRRAEAYWTLRKLLEDGRLALPHVPELREELLATRVRFGADGRTEIEGKEAIAGRLGRSPDYADALVISLAPLIENPNPRPKVRWC